MIIELLFGDQQSLSYLYDYLSQVPFQMAKKHFLGTNRYPLRILPSYYFLKSWGIKEPYIVAGAYIISCLLTAFAGYLGLVSA